jgi:hypothetical protein
MALTTYTELKASIADWLNRSDLTTVIPDFITLCEAQMNRDLNELVALQKSTTGTVDGTTTTIAVPADLLNLMNLVISDGTRSYSLSYIAPEDAGNFGTGQDRPRYYSVIADTYQVFPVPNQSYTYALHYVGEIPALSGSNASNWVLTNTPNLYLFGSLLEAAAYLGNDPRVPLWETKYAKGKETLLAQDSELARSGPLTIKVDAQTA